MAWPALDASTGSPSVPIGAFSSTVSSRSVDVEAAKAFVQWLWVDQTDYQLEFATAYGFHIPARNSLAAEADVLTEGPAANAVRLSQENGFTQTPILWTPASGTAYSDALNRIITQGADPETEIAEVKAIVDAELERVGAGGEWVDAHPSTPAASARRHGSRHDRVSLAAESVGGRPGRSAGAPPRGRWRRRWRAIRTTTSGSGCSSARSCSGWPSFVIAPVVWSLVLSLYEARNTVSPTEFVGLRNYREMLGDPAFRQSLVTFVAFAAFIVPLTFACSLGLALLVNRVRRGKALFRSVFFLPVACSYVVASMIWRMSIFNGVRFGLANTVLRAFGVEGRQWLSRPDPPLYWVVIVSERLWLQVGFYMLLFLAGLQRIPAVLYEAAAVDGATRGWQTFRYITFPQLRATSAAVIVLLLINAFQAFDEFYNLLVERRRQLPAVRPPAARVPLLRRPRAPAGLRSRQRRRRHPDGDHRHVHARPGRACSASGGESLWLRSAPLVRGPRPARRRCTAC